MNSNAIGGGGCEMGYGGIRKSLAVEFDTYQTVDRSADPDSNHIRYIFVLIFIACALNVNIMRRVCHIFCISHQNQY